MKKIMNVSHHPDEAIVDKILLVRGKKVMIDADLAELYGVATKRLNEQVKRNRMRFPEDFMFQLTEEEKKALMGQFPRLEKLKFSVNLPYVFTEHGAVMLASVLNSERAIEANIQIVRIFTRLREMLSAHQDILLKLEQLEKQVLKNNQDIRYIFSALKQLLNEPSQPRVPIGFKTGTKPVPAGG